MINSNSSLVRVLDNNINNDNRFKQLKMLVSTFNMGNAHIDNLDHLIPNRGSGLDIIALGFQESVYSLQKDTNGNGEGSPKAQTLLASTSSSTEALAITQPATTGSESTSALSPSKTTDSIKLPSPASSRAAAAVFAATSAATSLVKSKKVIGLESRNQLASDIGLLLGENFYMVQLCLNAQMQLIIFASKSLQADIHHIEVKNENTGFLSIFPNKGGLRISFSIYGTYLTFVSCHLAAHEGIKKCHIRNESTGEILGGLRLGDKKYDISCFSHHTIWMGDMNYRITMDKHTPADLDANDKKGVLEVTQADVDLDEKADDDDPVNNSQDSIALLTSATSFKDQHDATANNDRQHVLELIASCDWTALLQYDELNREIRSGRALVDFIPIPPTFPPTFKRTRQIQLSVSNSNISNSGSSSPIGSLNNNNEQQPPPQDDKIKIHQSNGSNNVTSATMKTSTEELVDYYNKKRMPSYTDRILYKSLPGFQRHLQVTCFESVESIMSSDHKPVRAYFNLTTTPLIASSTVNDSNNTKSTMKASRNNNNVNIMELQIHGLKGKNLKEMDSQLSGGLSDPYIMIHTDPSFVLDTTHVKSKLKSSVIKKNIHPEWNNEILTAIISSSSSLEIDNQWNIEMLLKESGHLFVTVWDYDMTTKDDLIGVCCLSFQEILTHCLADTAAAATSSSSSVWPSFPFSRNIYNNGLITGVVEGIITIVNINNNNNNNSSSTVAVVSGTSTASSAGTSASITAVSNQQQDDTKLSPILLSMPPNDDVNDTSERTGADGVKVGCRDRVQQCSIH